MSNNLASALDRMDRRILEVLQREGRITNAELAERVSLSASPCLRRVKALEEAGVIRGYAAQLDPASLGLGLTAFVTISLEKRGGNVPGNALAAAVAVWQEVLECHALTGEMDYLLRVAVTDLAHYSRFVLDKLLKLDGVLNIKSSFVLQEVKTGGGLPLDHLGTG
ncbi:MAG: Lrp/AsnC family transcriptional regulator [Sulfuritalea sp.]|nr:Lrp/AsnC family transcriptional regulator [Sulfuritalea sp.]